LQSNTALNDPVACQEKSLLAKNQTSCPDGSTWQNSSTPWDMTSLYTGSKKVRDKHVLKLIGKYLQAGVMINGRLEETRAGVPQGSSISPMISNILLDDLDKKLDGRNHLFARYATDFVISGTSISVMSRNDGKKMHRFSVKSSFPWRILIHTGCSTTQSLKPCVRI
jgi:hypothetical protein